MARKLYIVYSPMCFACQLVSRWQIARDCGFEVEEFSIVELAEGTREAPPVVGNVLDQMRNEGGFLFGPIAVFDDGRAMPFYEVRTFLKGGVPREGSPS